MKILGVGVDLVSNKRVQLLIKNKNHKALYLLQESRKFDLHLIKALKAKKYVEKITV